VRFDADTFNSWIALALRWFPIEGLHCRLRHTARGTIISSDVIVDIDHAWKVRCRCLPKVDDPTQLQWRAFLTPGFVNGRDAMITQDSFDPETKVTSSADVPLTDEDPPSLVLTDWRDPVASTGVSVNDDGELVYAAGEGYPPFFDGKGVRPPTAGGDNGDAPNSPGRTREIRAADIYLAVPRIATQTTISLLNAGLDSQTISISNTFVNNYALSGPATYRLLTKAQWEPPREPDLLERMQGTAVEPQTDELKIATVYMLSPPGAGVDAVPDVTWSPYSKHFVFWNLMHASRNQLPQVPDNPLLLPTGLAAGAGDALISSLLSPINDSFAQIQAYFAAANFSGVFYTI
jgi:hypothetical protein